MYQTIINGFTTFPRVQKMITSVSNPDIKNHLHVQLPEDKKAKLYHKKRKNVHTIGEIMNITIKETEVSEDELNFLLS